MAKKSTKKMETTNYPDQHSSSENPTHPREILTMVVGGWYPYSFYQQVTERREMRLFRFVWEI